MCEYHVNFKDVHLYYPSTVFNTRTLKQTIVEWLKLMKPIKILPDVHALQGFSINIVNGEKVGIIGRNGAGKSTLLKTIAGIYPIYSGSIDVAGRIRGLFDLSLGFEPDATGRENIMYRGLLLGETPQTIKDKVNDIINFAELGDFIDYPIKSYSAGMHVRLAFAISTMIDGDILLLDEIFGVGDARFVQKAKQRIMHLINNANIMVFVSHDFAAIRELCNRVLWVDAGKVIMDDTPDYVIKEYLNTMTA